MRISNVQHRVAHVRIDGHGREPIGILQAHLTLEFQRIGIIEEHPVVIENLVSIHRCCLKGLYHEISRVGIETQRRSIESLMVAGTVPVDFHCLGQVYQMVNELPGSEVIATDVVLVFVVVEINALIHRIGADHTGSPSTP